MECDFAIMSAWANAKVEILLWWNLCRNGFAERNLKINRVEKEKGNCPMM